MKQKLVNSFLGGKERTMNQNLEDENILRFLITQPFYQIKGGFKNQSIVR